MKDDWSLLVPYLAMVTGVQFGVTGVAKCIGALPYKKLDRLGKTLEAAVSMATGAFTLLTFVVLAQAEGPMADSTTDEHMTTAKEFVQIYLFLLVVFLLWALAIVFGGTKSRPLVLGLTAFAILANIPPNLSPEAAHTLSTGVQWILMAGAFGFVICMVCNAFAPARCIELVRDAISRRRRSVVDWLEPTTAKPHDSKPADQT